MGADGAALSRWDQAEGMSGRPRETGSGALGKAEDGQDKQGRRESQSEGQAERTRKQADIQLIKTRRKQLRYQHLTGKNKVAVLDAH
ncbi:hypothetical protein NDU88_008887 [Pleurodeles waltl]|uniref:Uncharacterized protein n=1 Tax=Pleurodeles waltl TaxID=8319 RepID=A0AAV7PQG5_PLEWA|nr:hypothetical protein NDU88_008887 [Pleurodeles waltl]